MASIANLIANPTGFDYRTLADPFQGYAQGVGMRRDLDLMNATKNGLPRGPDGQVDFGAAIDILARSGQVGQAVKAAQGQQQLQAGQAAARDFASLFGGGGAPAQAPMAPARTQGGLPAPPAGNVAGTGAGAMRPPVPSTPRVWGDAEAEAAGLYEPRAGGAPAQPRQQSGGTGLPSVQRLTQVLSNPNLPAAQRQIGLKMLEKAMNAAGMGGSEFGLTPIYGTDKDGKPVLLQVGKGGRAVQTQIPEGVTVSTGVDRIDLGTAWGLIDKRTGQMTGTVPKDVAGQAAAGVIGKAAGQAQTELPATLATAENALSVIDQIRNHPGKDLAVGFLGVVPGVPGTAQRDFIALLDQAKGQAFLQAFESLKGGGQITQVEGDKATQAIARLERTQSKAGFDKALSDLRSVIEAGMRRAKATAARAQGATQPQQTPVGPPAIGEVRKGYRFRGGNPADQNSWERL